jgi:membrane-associated protease RseP (regulator of RpoE activity)
MQRRLGSPFAITLLLSVVLAGCRTPATSQEDDKRAAMSVVLAHERAAQAYDFAAMDALHTPDARSMEESYPHPFEPTERDGYQNYKNAGIRIDYHPQDAVAVVHGDVAWVTVTLHSVWKADTEEGRALLGGDEWRATYAEDFILLRTPKGWKIDFGHTGQLPPDFGVAPDYQQRHGGMKFAMVANGGPAAKAGFQPGDVLIQYGDRKIDNVVDFERLRYYYAEGEKVTATVLRGNEKITEEVTLQAP